MMSLSSMTSSVVLPQFLHARVASSVLTAWIQYLVAFLDHLFDARLARIACVYYREDLLLEHILQVFSLLPDILCWSGSTDDDPLQVRDLRHYLIEVLTDTLVVFVRDLFSNTFEPSSGLPTCPALARYS